MVAPLSKTVKNVGANEKLELSIDLSNYVTKGSNTGGSGSDMSQYATLKANTFNGVQTMTGLTVKSTAQSGNPKIEMYNDGNLSGGMIASNYELNLYGPNKVTLMGLNGETYFTAWRDRATLNFSTNRTHHMDWQADGNVVLTRNNVVVWSINNYLTSDVRLKTDIKPLEGSSLEKVKQLTAKTYLWKDDLMGKGDKREIGLIAQEVAEVVPEVVSKMSKDSDTLGVAYTQLVPVLVEAVKELSAKVESLEAQLMSKE